MARRRRRSKQRAHDLRHMYGSMPLNSRIAAIMISEPGGLLSSDASTVAVRGGVNEWTPPEMPKVIVAQSIHHDPIGQMYSRGKVIYAEYMAALAYQELHALSQIGSMRSADPTQPYVMSGSVPDGISDQQQQAAHKLRMVDRSVQKKYGSEGLIAVRSLLIDRVPLYRMAKLMGQDDQQGRRYWGSLFRRCLGEVAVCLGFATMQRPRYARA